MPEGLSPELVRHVANLARLSITDDEVALYSEQLSAVANHFADVESLDTEGVLPATHALEMTNVFRDDVVTASLTTDELLKGAPVAESGRFRVPKILNEE